MRFTVKDMVVIVRHFLYDTYIFNVRKV